MNTIITIIIGLITGYIISIFQNAGKDSWNWLCKKFNLLKENYNTYKNVKKIKNEYNKEKEIIAKYEKDIENYNLRYQQNKLEILEQKIKEKYGDDAWGLWWLDVNDNNKIKSIAIHNDIVMYLPNIEYYEHIWKDMGELNIYEI